MQNRLKLFDGRHYHQNLCFMCAKDMYLCSANSADFGKCLASNKFCIICRERPCTAYRT